MNMMCFIYADFISASSWIGLNDIESTGQWVWGIAGADSTTVNQRYNCVIGKDLELIEYLHVFNV